VTAAIAPLLPGETLGGKYRIERVLGQGGMGIVVAARHLDLDERVAIKFLAGAPSEYAADRFVREARAAVKVKGEHVCRVFDFGRLETGEPYIVMEYLEGVDLAWKLKREGPQPVDRVVGWIVEVCAALAEAHEHGIVHRDLKPANVLVATRPDGSTCAKVLDFGISKLPQAETITKPDAMMGSPLYMSPEQIESARDVDVRSDVWSLGVVMYELLAGCAPFRGDSMLELAVQIRERDPRPLEALRPEVPSALRDAVHKCLAKKADDRYPKVADLVGALAPFAPAEVAPLVSRLLKHVSAAQPDDAPKVALDARASVETTDAPLQGTFSPLHTAVDRDRRGAILMRRWPLLAAVASGAALVAVVALRSSPPSVSVAPEAAASSIMLAPEPTASAKENGASPPVPSVVPDAGEAPALAQPVARSPSLSRMPKPAPPPAENTTAPPALSGVPVSDGPKPPSEVRKKRELDRDDP